VTRCRGRDARRAKGVVRAGGGRRRSSTSTGRRGRYRREPADLLAANDEVERRLSVEEEIERRTPKITPTRRIFERTLSNHVDAPQSEVRKQQRGRMAGMAKGGVELAFGDFASRLSKRLDQRSPDRSRAYRHDPSRQAWWQGLDPVFPDKPVTQKPRDPHGSGKGNPSSGSRS